MAVSNGQKVEASVVNNALMSRLIDTSTKGVLSLKNDASGNHVDNVQEEINISIEHQGSTSQHGVGVGSDIVGTNTDQEFTNKKFMDLLKARAGISIGNETLDDSWLIREDSGNLVFERRESSSYVEKFTLPDGALGANKLVQFASDAAYETEYGAPTGGEIYFNTTTNKVRIHDGSQWKVVGAEVVGKQEKPVGLINGTNVDFDLSLAPLSEDTILVSLDGLIIPNDLWSYDAGVITFVNAPIFGQEVYVYYLTEGSPVTPMVITGTWEIEYHILSAGEVTAKQFNLLYTPTNATKVMADAINGTPLYYGVDFNISGNVFNFNGLGLDGIVENGDVIRLSYFR